MRIGRTLEAECSDDVNLPRRIIQVVVAADDMCNGHIRIIDDDAEVVGRRIISTHNNKVIEIGIGIDDAAMHSVIDDDITR